MALKIVILGGGPGGLYCGLLLKKVDPRHDITIIERNPADVTYGWGVVFSDRTLASFQRADYKTYEAITDHLVIWDAIDVRYRGTLTRCGGHVLSSISRKQLLQILQQRCAELGVTLRFGVEIATLEDLSGYDLIVGADGINSLARRTYASIFQPRLEVGRAKYIWFGTDMVLDCFTFIFRENEHGLFQVHAYPFGGDVSTFIVECDEASWRRAGLDMANEAASIAYCERLFADDLAGGAWDGWSAGRRQPHHLLSNNSKWINFVTVATATWHHQNVVLLGDAAHTAHFSIGSGTKLAMEDAIALANALEICGGLEEALNAYEMERKPVLDTFQRAARESQSYFERIGRYLGFDPMQFTFHLLTRSGRISYDDLRLRDARFGDAVDRWFMGRAAVAAGVLDAQTSARDDGDGAGGGSHAPAFAGPVIAPPPMFAPLRLRALCLPNRVVVSPVSSYAAHNGMSDDAHLARLRVGLASGAGLVLTEPVAVSPDGRITSGCAGMYLPEHRAAWARIVAFVRDHSTAKVGLQLNHAGRRGSTRPRWEGLDRPLRVGNWPLVSASPQPYTPQSPVPRELDRAGMDRVRDNFVRAAQMAQEAGFDLVLLNFAHGYLLATFISPLTNVRTDAYGGPLASRMRFPLEVFDAVRAVWPAEKPLGVAISAVDGVPGGSTVEDAVVVAEMLKARGCDLVMVLAGQTTPDAVLPYGRGFLTALSDRVRNEADIATMTGGYITTANEVNTMLAAGHADLCVMEMLSHERGGDDHA